jgi:hypothetical protein
MMSISKRWRVDIFIDERDSKTRAEARLHNPDETGPVDVGVARRNPQKTGISEVGDELAAARAPSDLAHQLLDAGPWTSSRSPTALRSCRADHIFVPPGAAWRTAEARCPPQGGEGDVRADP